MDLLKKRSLTLNDIFALRLFGLRISLSLCILLPLCLGQYNHFLLESAPFLLERHNVFTEILDNETLFELLKGSLLVSTLAFSFGFKIHLTGTSSALLFHTLDYLSFASESHAWNFTTHVQLYVLLIAWTDVKASSKSYRLSPRTTLWGMGFLVALLYFQAGLSKLLVGGWSWCSTGDTIRGILYFHGTYLGHHLLKYPKALPLLATAVVIFELSILPLFLRYKNHLGIFLGLQLFHLSLLFLMGVSFWQLTILYLFIFDWTGSGERNRLGGPPNQAVTRR